MTPIIFEKLIKEEIDFLVTNDCGGRSFDVPDFSFDPACQKHDVNYWVGSTSEDRLKADRQFYYDMQVIVNDMPWYRRIYMRSIPWIYYSAVRVGASSSFNWKRKRSYEDLTLAMTLASHSEDLLKDWD